MTQPELYTLLVSTGLPTVYHSWKASGQDVPSLPYIVYLLIDTDNESADNKVHKKTSNYLVEVYSDKKDLASEQLLEDALDVAFIFYNKRETYIESEQLYQVVYSISII
jgi:hypothetical protein